MAFYLAELKGIDMNYAENAQLSPPLLTSNRIHLRPAKLTDFENIKSYRQDNENCKYIRPPENDEHTLKIVEGLSKPWKLEHDLWNGLVICMAGSDEVVGEIVFKVEDWYNQRAEIGYRLSEHIASKGICTEAARLLIEFLFTEIGFFKIVAKCDPRNTGSYKVMEKLGFKREAFFIDHYLMGDEWTDQYDYGLLAANW